LSNNFNELTPAAPAGKTNVVFQADGQGNISAYCAPVGSWTVVNKSYSDSPYTATGYQQVMVDASGGAVVVNLPSVTGGQPVKVTKIDSSANLVTLTPASGNIENNATLSLAYQGDAAETFPDGTNWWLT